MTSPTKGLTELMVNTVKGFYTELPKTCFGESLRWGVLRLAELVWATSAGSIFIHLISLATSGGGVAFSLLSLLVFALQLVCSTLVFVGVGKNEPRFVKPFFWLLAVSCVLCMLFAILGIVAAPFLPSIYSQTSAVYFGLIFTFCVIMRYCTQVVYALMQEMQTTSTTNSRQKSVEASSVNNDEHSDSASIQIDEDMFTNDARPPQYTAKLND